MLQVENVPPHLFHLHVNRGEEPAANGRLNGKKVVDPNRIPLPPAKLYEKERIMRIAGAALILIGAIGIAAGASLLVAACVHIAIPTGILLAAASVVTLAVSLALIFKGNNWVKQEYWKDQAFVDRIAERTEKQSFYEIIHRYGWERTCQYHFISKEKLTSKFLEYVQNEKMSYKVVCERFAEDIRKYEFIDWSALRPILMQEVKAVNSNIEEFKQQYGEQPLVDGVVSKNDPWFENVVLEGIKGLNYACIKQQFPLEIKKEIISQDQIAAEMRAQYDQSVSLEDFMKKQGGKKLFWNIFEDQILEPSYFREDLLKQTEDMHVHKIIETFGWEIFSRGMVAGSDFKLRFKREENKTLFSELKLKYSPNVWDIVNYGLIERQLVKPNILREVVKSKMTFEGIIANYSWKIFSLKIVNGRDHEIRERFMQLAKISNFRVFWSLYEHPMNAYQLLSPPALDIVKACKQRWQEADIRYKKSSEQAQVDHEQSIIRSETQRNNKIKEAKSVLDGVKEQIRNYNLSYTQAKEVFENRIKNIHKDLRILRNKPNPADSDERRLESEILASRQRLKARSDQYQVKLYQLTQQCKNIEENYHSINQQASAACEKAKAASVNLMNGACKRLKLLYEATLEKIDADFKEQMKNAI